ncbi:MAG: hypothetical protein HW386_1428, partial [Gammaproteobacteria bacterium]|nr:hypothetical protein [Gammaproteobacteria bacterium]
MQTQAIVFKGFSYLILILMGVFAPRLHVYAATSIGGLVIDLNG